MKRADIVYGSLTGQVVIDDEAFASADAEVTAMFDDDLGLA